MLPNSRLALVIEGVTASNGGTQMIGYIDRKSYDFCSVDILLTTGAVASNNLSRLQIGHATTTDVTNATNITALVGDGAGGFTIPACDTSNGNLHKFNVDCRGLSRYLHVMITPLTTQTAWCLANLHRGDESVDNTTTGNVLSLVSG